MKIIRFIKFLWIDILYIGLKWWLKQPKELWKEFEKKENGQKIMFRFKAMTMKYRNHFINWWYNLYKKTIFAIQKPFFCKHCHRWGLYNYISKCYISEMGTIEICCKRCYNDVIWTKQKIQ